MSWTEQDLKKTGLKHNLETTSETVLIKKDKPMEMISEDDVTICLAQRIHVTPMSINQAYTGKRYKTDKYRIYCKIVDGQLQRTALVVWPHSVFKIKLLFGVSTTLSDWDNPVKPFQDILSKRYGFNDKKIREAEVKIVIVKKGEEFIEFQLNLL